MEERPAEETRVTPLYEGRIVKLYLKEVTLPHGGTARLEIVHHPGAAAVVPLHDDGSVTLVRQYRHATGGYLYEIPAGLLEPGEPALECARRELKEETGLGAEDVTPLLRYHTTPGFSDEEVHLFTATGLTEGAQALEEDEVLTVVRLPLAEAMALVDGGGISDGKTLIALMAVASGIGGAA